MAILHPRGNYHQGRMRRHYGPVGYPAGYQPPGAGGVVGWPEYPGWTAPGAGSVVGHGHAERCAPANPLSPYEVDRAVRGGAPLSPMAKQAAAAGAVALAAGAQRIEAMYAKDQFGVNSGTAVLIAPGASIAIRTSPQKNIVPEQMFVGDTVATAFNILSIVCGTYNILATTEPVPAELYRVDSNVPFFKSIPLTVGMDFTVTVENKSGAPARFEAAVVGKGFWGLNSPAPGPMPANPYAMTG